MKKNAALREFKKLKSQINQIEEIFFKNDCCKIAL